VLCAKSGLPISAEAHACVCCWCRLDAVSRSAPTEILFTAPPLTASRSLGTNKYIDGTCPFSVFHQNQSGNEKAAGNLIQSTIYTSGRTCGWVHCQACPRGALSFTPEVLNLEGALSVCLYDGQAG
jgi:hypothetical protein